MSELILRLADHEDAESLAALLIESWRAAFDGLLAREFLASMSLDTQTERVTLQIARGPEVEVWVVENDAGITGYGSLGPDRSRPGSVGVEELYALYLHPASWRQGVGRRLHDHLLQRFAARSASGVSLWVLQINTRAAAFYRALGWTDTGERREINLGGDHQVIDQYHHSDL